MSNQKRGAISQYVPPHIRNARTSHIPSSLRASVTIPQTMRPTDDVVSLAVQPITKEPANRDSSDQDEYDEELAERRAAVAVPKSKKINQTAHATGSTQHEEARIDRLERILSGLQLELSTLKSAPGSIAAQVGAPSLKQLWSEPEPEPEPEPSIAGEDVAHWTKAVSSATPERSIRLADLGRPVGFDDLPDFEWDSQCNSAKSEALGEVEAAAGNDAASSEILSYCTEPVPPFVDLAPTTSANMTSKDDPNWQPHAIASLRPFRGKDTIHPAVLQNKYTKELLVTLLAGPNNAVEHSPDVCVALSAAVSTLPRKTFYLISQAHEPFLPKSPGEHGAKLTMFFNADVVEALDQEGNLVELPDYEDVPLFVDVGRDEYVYFGQYSQNRLSDTLDYDTMQRVPYHVKAYWAEELTRADRPDWVTEELTKALFPKPEYQGILVAPTVTGSEAESDAVDVDKKARREMKKYFEELREWRNEYGIKTAMLKAENILQAFERSTADRPAGLRLQWEYLECVGFDMKLFSVLNIMRTRPQYLHPRE